MNFPIKIIFTLGCYTNGTLAKKARTFIANEFESYKAFEEAITEVENRLKTESGCDYIKDDYSYVIDDDHYPTGGVDWTKLAYRYYEDSIKIPDIETEIELGDICKLYSNDYESTCIDTAVAIRGFHNTGVYRFHDAAWLEIPFSNVDLNYPLSVVRKHLDSIGMSRREYGTFLMSTLASDELRQEVKDLICENTYFTVFEMDGFNFSNHNWNLQMSAIYEFLIADETYCLGEELESLSLKPNSTKAEKMELVKQLLLKNGLLPTKSEIEV